MTTVGTAATESDESDEEIMMDEFISKVCHDLQRNFADDVLSVDNGGDLMSDSHLLQLSDSLRKNRTLRKLHFANCLFSRSGFMYLTTGIKKNQFLDTLSFDDCALTTDGQLLLDLLAISLHNHKSVRTVEFRSCHLSSHLQHRSNAIGSFLSLANNLRELRIMHDNITVPIAKALLKALMSHYSLQVLDLTGNGITDAGLAVMSEGLLKRNKKVLEVLTLDFNSFGDKGISHFSKSLRHNVHLKELSFFGNEIGAVGAVHLAHSLARNTCLESLILSFNHIGDAGVAALAQALTVNTTLKKIWFPSNSFSLEGLEAFAGSLPHMKGLNYLNIGLLPDDKAAQSLIQALKANTSLANLDMQKVIEEEEDNAAESLDFYLRLNRAGRKELNSPNLPASVWPRILERAAAMRGGVGSPDVLYWFLKEKIDLMPS